MQQDSSLSDEEGTCVACMANNARVKSAACSHIALCVPCFDRTHALLLDPEAPRALTCPLCREPFRRVDARSGSFHKHTDPTIFKTMRLVCSILTVLPMLVTVVAFLDATHWLETECMVQDIDFTFLNRCRSGRVRDGEGYVISVVVAYSGRSARGEFEHTDIVLAVDDTTEGTYVFCGTCRTCQEHQALSKLKELGNTTGLRCFYDEENDERVRVQIEKPNLAPLVAVCIFFYLGCSLCWMYKTDATVADEESMTATILYDITILNDDELKQEVTRREDAPVKRVFHPRMESTEEEDLDSACNEDPGSQSSASAYITDAVATKRSPLVN